MGRGEPQANNEAAWEALREAHPWPAMKPAMTPYLHGWHVHALVWRDLLARHERPLVVEVGAWCGRTTRYLCLTCPTLRIIAVDAWTVMPPLDQQWHAWMRALMVRPTDTLLDLYRVNLWPWRAQVTPVQADSVTGIRAVAASGLVPDIVYVDGDHTYDGARRDIEAALEAWPTAVICGDDWKAYRELDRMPRAKRFEILRAKEMNGVKWAAVDTAAAHGRSVRHRPDCCTTWWQYA